MDNFKFNSIFRKIVLVFLLVLFSLIIFDICVHQKYGLSNDPQQHMSIVNSIIKLKSLPEKDPLTGLDKMEEAAGYHTWLATVINLTALNKFAFVFRYSCALLAGIIFLLVFIFVRKIKNENIALLVMIILFFAGGIGWLFYPCIMDKGVSVDCLTQYAENMGLLKSSDFISRLIYPVTHNLGILLLLLFLYLLHKKNYFLAGLALSALSYTHKNNFVFASLLLIPLMISIKKEDIKVIIIPLLTLIFSFAWNFYPSLTSSYTSGPLHRFMFLMPFLTTENVLRLFLLASILLFFVFNRNLTKPLFNLVFLVTILLIITDAFFYFNKSPNFSIPFYKALFFLYGPLLISLFFINKIEYPKEIYCLLITCLVLTQLNVIISLISFDRILIILFVPLAVMYAALIDKSKKNFKIVLILLLLLTLSGGFARLNFYTLQRSFNDNIDTYNKSLIFIRDNLSENSRIITSPGFDAGIRINMIIPSIAERYVYTEDTYDPIEPHILASKEFRDSGLNLDEWKNKKEFLYKQDYLSRLCQIDYLFKNPDMNISGTKIEELVTHILAVKKECSLFKPYYTKIYEDDKVCIFEIKKYY